MTFCDFLQLPSWFMRSREAMENPVPFALLAWISNRFFPWAVDFSYQSNGKFELRMEKVVLC